MMVVGLIDAYGDEICVTKFYNFSWQILHPQSPLWERPKNLLKISKRKRFKILMGRVTKKINVMVSMDRVQLSEGYQTLSPAGIY